ncbi:hypothetical protein [Massilia rhizosphaerae]|uniref:hypothetical protein n=1 Tax=Massilia rhizosphaerae TaxID=2784389 RepID=UPI0018DE5EA8|nr:hypothetical protein [Massilia rhizosphaerae]
MSSSKELEDTAFFYYTIQSIHYLEEIPIAELRELDIVMLQRISKAATYDGLMLVLAVDFHDKNLIVERYCPDKQSKPLLPFSESPDSAIYISNEADPYEVIQKLQEISERYDLLNAPQFQKYADDETENCGWTVPIDEYLEENAKAKYNHEVFMRNYGMHQIVIPADYKKRACQLKLVKNT